MKFIAIFALIAFVQCVSSTSLKPMLGLDIMIKMADTPFEMVENAKFNLVMNKKDGTQDVFKTESESVKPGSYARLYLDDHKAYDAKNVESIYVQFQVEGSTHSQEYINMNRWVAVEEVSLTTLNILRYNTVFFRNEQFNKIVYENQRVQFTKYER